ncbi:hypothetical protein VL15_37110 [Burkholderia cepacia]|uniref:Hint domain-containing protein n=1 Tax=Burkholderia cepacia TaxID=292 RepID=A0A0J5Z229_BURCE|nr:hypothetical protein [Burkholderia cepacia]KML43838.1 hypothetical protein VL15_37110 [Burkholderia cepacia]
MTTLEGNWADVGKLSEALPPEGANPIGSRARAIYVNRIQGATPGNYSQLFGTGRSFRSIFFSNYAPDAEAGNLASLVGFSDDFWRQFSVAALCQQMYAVTSSLRRQLLIDDIDRDIAAWNASLRAHGAHWYAYVAAVTDGVIKSALAPFSRTAVDMAAARTDYIRGLTSDAWINMKRTQDATGNWPDRDWELFHHWIKLVALGARDAEIDSTISTVVSKGLPVPQQLMAGNWLGWSNWMLQNLGGADLSDATGAMLKEVCNTYPGSQWPSCMREANSYEFTANSQPGSRYRHVPGGSCFAPGSMVVLADGTLKAIESIRSGDEVRTPRGKRSVVLRAAPMRSDRPLFRFAGVDFAFTSGHPFLIHASKAGSNGEYAAVNPEHLAASIPGFNQFGIRRLGADGAPDLICHAPEGEAALRPVQPRDIEPAPLEGVETLYDLVLEPDGDDRSEYFIGDRTTQLLVSSELPRFLSAPATTAVMLHLLKECAGPALSILHRVPDTAVHDLLNIALDSIALDLLPVAVASSQSLHVDSRSDVPLLTPGVSASLTSAVSAFAARFSTTSTLGYDQRMGAFLDLFLSKFAHQFHDAVRQGWRRFDLAPEDESAVLAVSIRGLEFFEALDVPPLSDAELSLTLQYGQQAIAHTVPVDVLASTAGCLYVGDGAAYISGWRQAADTASSARLRVALRRRSDRKDAEFVGVAYSPFPGCSGFLSTCHPVLAGDGRMVGRVTLDVRCLAEPVRTSEEAARAAWTSADEAAFAARLAQAAAARFVERFKLALLTYQGKAVTAAARDLRLMAAD